jgi:glycosyltransferase involved in cell wall biosynthesis
MPTMLISVVIPAYNEEQYLGRCLAALARQTCPADRFEVILVDNGSTDATAEIARRYRGATQGGGPRPPGWLRGGPGSDHRLH